MSVALPRSLLARLALSVRADLQLTDAEGTAFWPVYEAYQKDLQAINQRMASVIMAYAAAYNKGPVADDVAKKLLDDAQAVDEAEVKLKASATRWLRRFRSSSKNRVATSSVQEGVALAMEKFVLRRPTA